MALASIFVLAGLERRVWEGLAALPVVRPVLPAVDLGLAVVRPGSCPAVLVVPSTATTPCTWGGRAWKKACRRSWVRTLALVVLITAEELCKDRLTGPVTTACLPLCLVVVPVVAASTDTDTATLPTDTGTDTATLPTVTDTNTAILPTDTDTDTATLPTDTDIPPLTDSDTTAEGWTATVKARVAGVWRGKLVGLGKMVLVATEAGWVGLAALFVPRPVPTTGVGFRLAAVRPGPCTALLIRSPELATQPYTWGRRARKRACPFSWVRTEALDTAILVTT